MKKMMKTTMTAAAGALAALLTAAGPAAADWEYTRWSMTPDALIAASAGKARRVAGREGQRVHGYDLMAEADHRWQDFDLHAEFYFSPRKELKVVRLTVKDPARCDAARKAVQAIHGEGEFFESTIGDRPFMTAWHWRDRQAGNFIGFTDTVAIGNLPRLCFIRLRPIAEG